MGVASETSSFYLKPSSGRKSVCTFVRQLEYPGTVLVRLNTANETATLKALEASANLARVQADRWQELGKQQLVSKDEVQQRLTAAATAQAQADAQRALIAQKTIRAPFAGILGIRKVNLGQFVSPGDPIVSLQQLDPIYVNFALPGQMIGKMVEGTAVHATLDSLPGQSFGGLVTAVDPQVDPDTRNFQVQATLRNPDRVLRPGAFARPCVPASPASPHVRPVLAFPDDRGAQRRQASPPAPATRQSKSFHPR